MTSEEMFKVGQIVRLKSGGPEMTVKRQRKTSDEEYECEWFAGKKLEHGTFPHDSLKIVEPQPDEDEPQPDEDEFEVIISANLDRYRPI